MTLPPPRTVTFTQSRGIQYHAAQPSRPVRNRQTTKLGVSVHPENAPHHSSTSSGWRATASPSAAGDAAVTVLGPAPVGGAVGTSGPVPPRLPGAAGVCRGSALIRLLPMRQPP